MQAITVLASKVSEAVAKTGRSYKICELNYKTEEGKVKGMRIFGFGPQKSVFDIAAKSEKGDVLNAVFEQDDKGYWRFGNLESTGQKREATVEAVAPQPSTPSRSGNWETTEERAARQILIVRQSSASTAVALSEANKSKSSVEDIIKVAKEIEAYVLGKPAVQSGEVE